jgi:ElaB/YqjD/DUF883 family membrane-anchored ribosome-binding protein
MHDFQPSDFLRRQADRGSRELGERLNAVADGLESRSDQFAEHEKEIASGIARYVSLVLRRAGTYLERTDSTAMIQDARAFARRQPWTVVAAGLVAGFALSRALKNVMAMED